MRSTIGGVIALTVAAALLAGCGKPSGKQYEPVDPVEADNTRDRERSTLGDLFEFNKENSGPAGQALPINRYLWRASLDTLEFLPLVSTDPFSGVIATDWSAASGSPDERFKVTVYISSPELEARSLRVAVYRELRDQKAGAWVPAEVSEATPRRLEDAILTRARQLRVSELNSGEG